MAILFIFNGDRHPTRLSELFQGIVFKTWESTKSIQSLIQNLI